MPPLPDEIVEEIYLRLPPDEPACLVRASLASKLWLGILTGPRFTARYCDFHGAPPMLGFCRFRDNLPDPAKPYFSTTRFGPRIPEDKGRGSSNYGVYDCRHGRLLLKRGHNKPTPTPLFLWDPMTGRWREMHAELYVYNAAVLCAVTGCDHRACHKGPSLVVSVGVEDKDAAATRFDGFFGRTWSSQTGQWSERCYCHDLPLSGFMLPRPSVLIGDALFFIFHYTGEDEENHEEDLIGFVIYHLGSSTLSVLRAPPLYLEYDDLVKDNYIHMAMEDGTLGFAHVDNSVLYLYSRRTGSDAANEPWTQHTGIHLNKLLPIQNPREHLQLLGSVEGRDIIFVSAYNDVYEIDLKSLQYKKLWKNDGLDALIPYMSFYHPRDILEKLLKDGLLSTASKDSYAVNKITDPRTPHIKKEVVVQNISPTEEAKTNDVDVMYMKALYHALPMDYVTIAKLQGKLDGEASQNTVRKLIDKMVQDGYIKNSGKAVIHSEASNRKLLEIKKILEVDLDEAMATDTNPGPAEFDCRERPMTDQEMKDGSTNSCFHSVRSDLTRTRELWETEQTTSVQKDPNRTRTSMCEPATSLESGVLGKTRKSLASVEDTQQGK